MTEQLTEEGPATATAGAEPAQRSGAGAAPDRAIEPAGPIRVSWAQVPRVNLLPVEIIEARRFRRTQVFLAGALVGSVLVAGGATYAAQSGVSTANTRLATAQSQVGAMQAEQAKYAAVPQVLAQVSAARTARTAAMSRDVLWYVYLNDLAGAEPTGVRLSTVSGTLNAQAAGAAAPNTDPLGTTGIGTLTLAGGAGSYPQVSAYLEALNKVPGLVSATLVSATRDSATGAVTFSITVVPTSDALSGRYDTKAG